MVPRFVFGISMVPRLLFLVLAWFLGLFFGISMVSRFFGVFFVLAWFPGLFLVLAGFPSFFVFCFLYVSTVTWWHISISRVPRFVFPSALLRERVIVVTLSFCHS